MTFFLIPIFSKLFTTNLKKKKKNFFSSSFLEHFSHFNFSPLCDSLLEALMPSVKSFF